MSLMSAVPLLLEPLMNTWRSAPTLFKTNLCSSLQPEKEKGIPGIFKYGWTSPQWPPWGKKKVAIVTPPLSPPKVTTSVHYKEKKLWELVKIMITKWKMIWFFIKFSQLHLILWGNVWQSVWRIFMLILGIKGIEIEVRNFVIWAQALGRTLVNKLSAYTLSTCQLNNYQSTCQPTISR